MQFLPQVRKRRGKINHSLKLRLIEKGKTPLTQRRTRRGAGEGESVSRSQVMGEGKVQVDINELIPEIGDVTHGSHRVGHSVVHHCIHGHRY